MKRGKLQLLQPIFDCIFLADGHNVKWIVRSNLMGISSEADFLLNKVEPDSVFTWDVCITVQLGVRSQQQRSEVSTEYSMVSLFLG